MVSALSNTPLPPAPAAQCATALPGKCPPICSNVMPGRRGRVRNFGLIDRYNWHDRILCRVNCCRLTT